MICEFDQKEYIIEAEEQLNSTLFANSDKDLILNKSSTLFKTVKGRLLINEDEFKYSHFEFKKNCNIGKLHLPPKTHKSLLNIPEI